MYLPRESRPTDPLDRVEAPSTPKPAASAHAQTADHHARESAHRSPVIELRNPIADGSTKRPSSFIRRTLRLAARCTEVIGKTVHRWPVVSLLLFTLVVWFVVNEQHEVVEEQLREKIRELSVRLDARREPFGIPTAADEHEAAKIIDPPSDAARAQPEPSDRALVSTRVVLDGSERDDAFLGPGDAPVLVMVMTDLQCERCGTYYRDVIEPLSRALTAARDTRLIMRDLPLPANAHAVDAAQLAQCAGEQSRYFEAVDVLISRQKVLERGDISTLAREIHVDYPDRLMRCFQSHRYAVEIEKDKQFSLRLGATGVPTTFIGRRGPDGAYTGQLIRGAQPLGVIAESLRLAGSAVDLRR